MKNMVTKIKLEIALGILPESFVLDKPIRIKHFLSTGKLLLTKGVYKIRGSFSNTLGEPFSAYFLPNSKETLVIGMIEFNQIKKHLRI